MLAVIIGRRKIHGLGITDIKTEVGVYTDSIGVLIVGLVSIGADAVAMTVELAACGLVVHIHITIHALAAVADALSHMIAERVGFKLAAAVNAKARLSCQAIACRRFGHDINQTACCPRAIDAGRT